MSRAASVTLEFIADLAPAEQRYEAFVRKVSQPIPLNFVGAPGASPANAQSATFGTPGTPYTRGVDAGPGGEPAMREAFQRRADSERMVATANERYAAAVTRQATSVDVSTNTRQTQAIRGPASWQSPSSAAAGVYRDSPGRSVAVEQSPGNDGILTADELSGLTGGSGRQQSGRGGRGVGGLARMHILYRAVGSAVNMLKAYQENQIENRLAVSDGGQTDLMRQFKADTDFADKVEQAGGPGGMFGGVLREYITHDREAAQRTLQQAELGERRYKAVKAQGDFTEDFQRRNAIERQPDQASRAVAEAEDTRQQQEKAAQKRRDDEVALNMQANNYDTSKPDEALNKALEQIREGYNHTLDKISKSYAPIFDRIKDEIPALAARAAGNTRTAERIELQADIKEETANAYSRSSDLGRYTARHGKARLDAFDAEQSRNDTADIEESGYRREAFQRKSIGDDLGELLASQAARRVQRLRGIGQDDPRRKAFEDELTAQEGSENADFTRNRNLRLGALQGDVAISGLQAQGKPNAAAVEGIYRRSELSAQKDVGHPDEAALELQIGYNNLEAYKRRITQGGHGEEVAAGSLGPGGTQGSEPDDSAETLKTIDEKMAALLAEMQKLNSTMAGSD